MPNLASKAYRPEFGTRVSLMTADFGVLEAVDRLGLDRATVASVVTYLTRPGFAPRVATVYGIVAHLEDLGLLSSEVRLTLGRPPRHYALTNRGRVALDLGKAMNAAVDVKKRDVPR